MISDQDCGIGGLPIPVLDDKKPIEEFLTLKERMEVALLVSNDVECWCAGLRIIEECSPQGVWCRFHVPHSFFVVMNISKVNFECNHHTAYCKEESITTLGAAINRRVLWSGYKVKPTEPLGSPLGSDVKDEGIGGLPIPFQPRKVRNESSGFDMKANDRKESEIDGHTVGSKEKVDNGDTDSSSANPDRPLWRGRICYLLKDDLSILGKAKIVVCLSDEPFDEENLEDTNAGVLFLSDRNLQMTSFRWPLAQVRLEGGRLLSKIVTWCSKHGESSGDNSGLEGEGLIVLRSSSALFMTKWITPNLPSPKCSGPQRRHLDLGRSPYLLPGCSRMDTVTERMLTTPQHFGPGTQTSLSPLFVGF